MVKEFIDVTVSYLEQILRELDTTERSSVFFLFFFVFFLCFFFLEKR